MTSKCRPDPAPLKALRLQAELGAKAIKLICDDLTHSGDPMRTLAARIHVSYSSVQGFVRGRKAPTTGMARRIIAAYAKAKS